MENDKRANNNNMKTVVSIAKWLAPILAFMITAFFVWLGTTGWEMVVNFKASQATYKSDQVGYQNELKSMAADRAAMRVEEVELRKRLREAERLLDRLIERVASLEEYIRR